MPPASTSADSAHPADEARAPRMADAGVAARDALAPAGGSSATPPVSLQANRPVATLATATAISLLGALLVTWHDGYVIDVNLTGHNFVMPVMLALLFFLAVLNGALARFAPRLALSAGQLAVVITLVLVAGPLPRFLAYNLVETVGHVPALIENKHQDLREFQRANPYDALPPQATLSVPESQGYASMLGERSGELAHPGAVPWRAWIVPLLFWAPLLVSFVAFSLSLAYLLYRQWAHRELVPFPLAQVAAAVALKEKGRPLPDVFYQPLFWSGLLAMVVIFSLAGLHAHFERAISIPTKFSFYALSQQFVFLKSSHEGYSLLRATLYFTVIAVAVLLPGEISFTAWVTWPVMILATYFFYVQTGQKITGLEAGSVMQGAWWAMAGLILYAGRWYYLGVLQAAVGLRRDASLEPISIWAARLLLVSTLVLLLAIWRLGVPLDLALVWVAGLLVMMLVLCRLVAEMGLPWAPVADMGPLPVMVAAGGAKFLGAKAYALLSIIGSLTLTSTPAMVPLAPMTCNAIHVENRVTGRHVSARLVGPFLAVILVAVSAMLILSGYSHEGADDQMPLIREVIGASKRIAPILPAGGDAAAAMQENASLSERWGSLAPRDGFVGFFLLGIVLVLGTGGLRLRFPRFPLHPLPLVLLGSWVMSRYWSSFLVGWLIKKALIKIGGGNLFDRVRPVFIGMVIGQVVVALIWVVINLVLYVRHGMVFDPGWFLFMRDLFSA